MWMASFLPFYVAEKHALLQSKCTRSRLRSCLKCIASMEAVSRRSNPEEQAARAAAPPQPPPSHPPPQNEAASAGTAEASSSGTGAAVGTSAPGATAEAEAPVSEGAEGS